MPKAERVESHVWHGRNLKDRQRNGTRWLGSGHSWKGGAGGTVERGVCLALPKRVREPRHTLACQFHVQWQKVIHLVIFYLYMFSPPLLLFPPSLLSAALPLGPFCLLIYFGLTMQRDRDANFPSH